MGRHPDGTVARTERVAFRVTEDGLKALTQAAKATGESVSEYVRNAVAHRVQTEVQLAHLRKIAPHDALMPEPESTARSDTHERSERIYSQVAGEFDWA